MSTTPTAKPEPTKRQKIMGFLILIVLVFVLAQCMGGGGDDKEAASSETTQSATEPSAVPATEAPTAPAAAPAKPAEPPAPKKSEYGVPTPDQQAFIDAAAQGETAWEAAGNDLQRSVAISDRDAQMCAVSGEGTMRDWQGKIVDIGANGDGLAYVTIELAEGVTIETWNNALSDVMDNTLIPQSAPFFGTLTEMDKGTIVTFSADTVSSDTSCLKRTNVTESFYAVDPHFLVTFSDIRPA